ncbi:MAG: 5-(carboxyamino)imidazole ribonucleotide synthase [Burkholderiaceae bacterium]|jgi:5-(carboxyamino)imidazole ribonucleotide synthase|nr:5-(carboxyamino)imidazole ribonucleotide synthase [Burkholderiaceae bacterium]
MNPSAQPLLPGATLGVLGGGQLGRMFAHAAQQMGYFTTVLDPASDSSAGRVSHHHVHTDFLDGDGLARLARLADAVTIEFENVPAQALTSLAGDCRVAPDMRAVAIAQNRIREKAHFVQCGVPCAPYAVIESAGDIGKIDAALLPGILKIAQLGYDGKGQQAVETHEQLSAAWQAVGQAPCVLEQRLALAGECSVVLARGSDAAMVHFAPQRNTHVEGILALTQAYEGAVPAAQAQRAIDAARAIAESLNYVGVLCVEFFILADGALVINEMAPRPHNSGHYTLDACDISQFDLQVRTLAGLPLSAPRQHSPAVMLNLLGDLWFPQGGDAPQEPPWAAALALPGVHLHLYGKTGPRRGRKMGHLTVTAASAPAVCATAARAARALGIALPPGHGLTP